MTFSTVRRSTMRECSVSSTSLALATPRRRSSIETSGISSAWAGSSMGSLAGSLFTVWSSSMLNVQVLHELSVGLNEGFAQLNLCTHQLAEDGIGFFGVLHPHLHQDPLLGVHSGLEQLVGVHFAEAFVAPLLDKAGLLVGD